LGRVSKSRAAIDRAEESASKNNKKPVPGRYFIAEPRVIDGGEFPTRDEWLQEVALKKGNNTSMSKFGTQRDSANIIQGRK